MKCPEKAACEKGCSWTSIDCFLSQEVHRVMNFNLSGAEAEVVPGEYTMAELNKALG
jgi:hypothetical protein